MRKISIVFTVMYGLLIFFCFRVLDFVRRSIS